MSSVRFDKSFWKKAIGIDNLSAHVLYWGYHSKLKVDICVFKKLKGGHIANLIIPAGSRVHITNGKCRADKAYVHSIFHMRTKKEVTSSASIWESSFLYEKGKTVIPRYGFSMRQGECESGIHFFIRLGDAKAY